MEFGRWVAFFFCAFLAAMPLGALDVKALFAKLQDETPAWMKQQIQKDLSPYTTELSQKNLDALFSKEELCLVRVKVSKGNLTIQKSGWAERHPVPNQILPHIYTLHGLLKLPDIDFLFTAHDTIPCSVNGPPWPIFVIAKSKESPGMILIPDWFALRGYEPEKSEVLEGNRLYPWHLKQPLLFFRGADSGVLDVARWKEFPRPKLVRLSNQHPDLIDAKFPGLHHGKVYEMALREGYIGNYIGMREHPSYRYLIDLDGNCASAPRFALLMHSNSVILKQMTDSIQWFYNTIKPYQHYIPVDENLTDIFTQLAWAKENEAECLKMSENCRILASEVLSHEAIYLFLYRLLEAYAAKQRSQYAASG